MLQLSVCGFAFVHFRKNTIYGFPEFDLVPFGVHNVHKFSIIVSCNGINDFDAGLFQLGDEFFDILNPVIDHERAVGGLEIFCLVGERAPGKVILPPRLIGVAKFEGGTIFISYQAEVLSVTSLHFFRVFAFEENSSDAGDFFTLVGHDR